MAQAHEHRAIDVHAHYFPALDAGAKQSIVEGNARRLLGL